MTPDTTDLLTKITSTLPALVTVYNITTGEYIFVNDALTKILGYRKEKLLKEGASFAFSLVHPDDLELITSQNTRALKDANKKSPHDDQNQPPTTYEYRMRHKNNSWRWLHTDGTVFSRDKKGKVEYIMNVSIDITNQKERELKEIEKGKQIELEKNKYYEFQIRSTKLRANIADIISKYPTLTEIADKSLAKIVKNLPTTFSRLWLYNEELDVLELISSAGDHPPNNTIRKTLKVGEFAEGLIAERKKHYITNNLYQNSFFHIQNIPWAKKKKIQSFAGYPLIVKNKLIGVLAVFANYPMEDDTINILANITDLLAQDIERRKIEQQLNESKERYLSFISQSSEGIWRFEVERPIDIRLSPEKQINQFYRFAYLAECNDALAKMHGYKKATDIIGARLGDMLTRNNPDNISYLKKFISQQYTLSTTELIKQDKSGNIRCYQNSLIGIVENNFLIRAWGIQQDITERKKSEQDILKLSKQKDEFIAIASHELKTPVTSLKAYTQILEYRLKNTGDESLSQMLTKMDHQLNKLTALISDLLDISRIEAGKLQFTFTNCNINQVLKETVEEIGNTTETHKLILKTNNDCVVKADSDRISQVIINFISNAIKYSPNANKVLIKSTLKKKSLVISVTDFGIGINKKDQRQIFDRFFRAPTPQSYSYPGLGLGLYISSEIIKRHNGEIGVKSTKGKGSTFWFSLPIK